jgi:hypothetical protein
MFVSPCCPLAGEFHIIRDIGGDQDELLTGGVAQLFCIGQALPLFVNDRGCRNARRSQDVSNSWWQIFVNKKSQPLRFH